MYWPVGRHVSPVRAFGKRFMANRMDDFLGDKEGSVVVYCSFSFGPPSLSRLCCLRAVPAVHINLQAAHPSANVFRVCKQVN